MKFEIDEKLFIGWNPVERWLKSERKEKQENEI